MSSIKLSDLNAEIDRLASLSLNPKKSAPHPNPYYRPFRPDRDRHVPIEEGVIAAILRRLDPTEYHQIAPFICKQWHKIIRSKPRPVLLNLRIVFSASSSSLANASPAASSSSQAATTTAGTAGDVRITTPVPLDDFTPVPAKFKQLGSVVGEGCVATMQFATVPDTPEGLTALIKTMMAVLVSRAPRRIHPGFYVDGSEGIENPVVLLPWEVQISGDQLTDPKDLGKLSKILAILDPRVLKIARPPTILFHLLPPNISILHLICYSKDDVVDFSPLSGLSKAQSTIVAPFGRSLVQLTLESPVLGEEGVNGSAVAPHADEEDDESGMYEPEDLEPLVHVTSLRILNIGMFFPILDLTGLIPILCKMQSLKDLSVRGLYQGDQPPEALASLVTSLPNLKHLGILSDLWVEFWAELKNRQPFTSNLDRLHLAFDQPTFNYVREAITGAIQQLPNLRELRMTIGENKCDILSPKIIVQMVEGIQELQKLGELPKTALRILSVSGMPMSMESIMVMGRHNINSVPNGGISVRIKASREAKWETTSERYLLGEYNVDRRESPPVPGGTHEIESIGEAVIIPLRGPKLSLTSCRSASMSPSAGSTMNNNGRRREPYPPGDADPTSPTASSCSTTHLRPSKPLPATPAATHPAPPATATLPSTTSTEVQTLHVARTVSALSTVPTAVMIFVALSPLLPIGVVIVISLYFGLLTASAIHGSLSAVAAKMRRRFVIRRSERGHLEIALRRGGVESDRVEGDGDVARVGDEVVVEEEIVEEGGVWRKVRRVVARAIEPQPPSSPTTGLGAAVATGVGAPGDIATILVKRSGGSAGDAFRRAQGLIMRRSFAGRVEYGDVVPPPPYQAQDTTTKGVGAGAADEAAGPVDVKWWVRWKESAIRTVAFAFLALPVLVHACSSLMTTFAIETAHSVMTRTIRLMPIILGKFVGLLKSFKKKVVETVLHFAPHLIDMLSTFFSYTATLTVNIATKTVRLLALATSGLKSGFKRLGLLIHDAWEPCILPFLTGCANYVITTSKAFVRWLRGVWPWWRAAIGRALDRIGAAIVKTVEAARWALDELILPAARQLRAFAAWSWARILAMSEVARRVIHAAVEELHALIVRLGVIELLERIPIIARRCAAVVWRAMGRVGGLLHRGAERLVLFLERRRVFARVAAVVHECVKFGIKYGVAGALLFNAWMVVILAYTKRLAAPVIEAVQANMGMLVAFAVGMRAWCVKMVADMLGAIQVRELVAELIRLSGKMLDEVLAMIPVVMQTGKEVYVFMFAGSSGKSKGGKEKAEGKMKSQ
ncbi:hypothetical protein HK101_005819 [Irineochytrium annulatum]|nr:hypothetical protein HK101_005819 [Irineochytrium annulatum]